MFNFRIITCTDGTQIIECVPQITEMALEIKKNAPAQYLEFEKEHLEEVKKSCPISFKIHEKDL